MQTTAQTAVAPVKTVTRQQLQEALQQAAVKLNEVYKDECFGTISICLRPDGVRVELNATWVFRPESK